MEFPIKIKRRRLVGTDDRREANTQRINYIQLQGKPSLLKSCNRLQMFDQSVDIRISEFELVPDMVKVKLKENKLAVEPVSVADPCFKDKVHWQDITTFFSSKRGTMALLWLDQTSCIFRTYDALKYFPLKSKWFRIHLWNNTTFVQHLPSSGIIEAKGNPILEYVMSLKFMTLQHTQQLEFKFPPCPSPLPISDNYFQEILRMHFETVKFNRFRFSYEQTKLLLSADNSIYLHNCEMDPAAIYETEIPVDTRKRKLNLHLNFDDNLPDTLPSSVLGHVTTLSLYPDVIEEDGSAAEFVSFLAFHSSSLQNLTLRFSHDTKMSKHTMNLFWQAICNSLHLNSLDLWIPTIHCHKTVLKAICENQSLECVSYRNRAFGSTLQLLHSTDCAKFNVHRLLWTRRMKRFARDLETPASICEALAEIGKCKYANDFREEHLRFRGDVEILNVVDDFGAAKLDYTFLLVQKLIGMLGTI